MAWLREAPTFGVPSQVEVPSAGETEKRAFRRTGESKAILERLTLLKNEGMFKVPRELGEIRREMQTRGWYHLPWNIQSVLLRHGAKLGIKRVMEAGKYKYVEV